MTDETQGAGTDSAPPVQAAPAAPPAASAKSPPAPAASAINDREAAIDRVLDQWVASLRNSPVSRFTPAWNHFQLVGLPALKASLKQELAGQ